MPHSADVLNVYHKQRQPQTQNRLRWQVQTPAEHTVANGDVSRETTHHTVKLVHSAPSLGNSATANTASGIRGRIEDQVEF